MRALLTRLLQFTLPASIALFGILLVLPISHFALDLLRSFAFHYMLLCALLTLMAIIRGQTRLFASTAATFLLLFFYLAEHILPNPGSEPTGEHLSLRVGQFNVLFYTQRHDALARQAASLEADLLSFQEVNQSWKAELDSQLCSRFPYVYATLSETNPYGLLLYSRFPLQDTHVLIRDGVRSLSAKAVTPQGKVRIVTTHTQSPMSTRRHANRNQHLAYWADTLAEEQELPTLLIGDMNAVPWDPGMVRLRKQSRLQDARTHLADTFPSWLPVVGLPIDYILHSEHFERTGFRVLDRTSSDHRGIVADFYLRG